MYLLLPVVMNPEKHVRFSPDNRDIRDRRSDLIKSFVWPALMDGNRCVFRAVVLTWYITTQALLPWWLIYTTIIIHNYLDSFPLQQFQLWILLDSVTLPMFVNKKTCLTMYYLMFFTNSPVVSSCLLLFIANVYKDMNNEFVYDHVPLFMMQLLQCI